MKKLIQSSLIHVFQLCRSIWRTSFLVLAFASMQMTAMECQPELSPSDLPHSSEVIAWRIQIREALRRGDLETASAIIESRRLHPSKEVIEIIQNNNLGIPLAFVAAQKNHNLTLKFLRAENLIDPKALSDEFQHAVQEYLWNFKASHVHWNPSNIVNSYIKIASLFDQAMLDPNVVDKIGRFLFHQAVDTGYVELVDYWLKHGANPNLPEKVIARTPLFFTAQELRINSYSRPTEMLQILEILLKAKADPNLAHIHGDTPLMILVRDFNPDKSPLEILRQAIKLLLKHGANPNLKDGAGKTALDYLQDRGPEFEKIRRMLRKVMAAEKTVEEEDPFGSWE